MNGCGHARIGGERRTELQQAGSTAFRNKDLQGAYARYTEAIELGAGQLPVAVETYSNRSAVALQMHDVDAALADADRVIAIKPDWAKGHSRRANALHAMCKSGQERWAEAEAAYRKALEYDPANETIKRGLSACENRA